jgi:hypothetical protein
MEEDIGLTKLFGVTLRGLVCPLAHDTEKEKLEEL